MRLNGKKVLITGGTRGIGLAAAQEFHREGARVALCGRDTELLEAARATIGQDGLAFAADVSRSSDLDALFAAVRAEFGTLDVLFVNAGYSQFEPFEQVTEQTFDDLVAANLKGAFFTIQKALPLLNPGASIILNSSVVGQKGWPGTVVVAAIKAGLRSMARTLSTELLARNIRVNSISPGPIDTYMFARTAGDEMGVAVKSMLAASNPSKRLGTPLEVAKLALYLASDESAFVVGADFGIDGGVGSL
jgi:NAD(P)-dependent dehydrogenase (short-subunit alcohol dehydrogenase family)